MDSGGFITPKQIYCRSNLPAASH